MGSLPEAGLFHKNDFIPTVECRLAVGGIMSVIAGIAVVMFPPAGLVIGGGAIFGTSLAGVDVENSQDTEVPRSH